jgi:hypothetical protein
MAQTLLSAILPLALVGMGYVISNRFTRLERRTKFLEERVKLLEQERSSGSPPPKSRIRSLKDT